MLTVISPAKKLDFEDVSPKVATSFPVFQDDAYSLSRTARRLSVADLRKLMKRINRFIGRRATREPERIVRDLNRMSITVSEVRVTPDLRIATAFVLPLGGKDKEEAIAALARNKWQIRQTITKQMSVKHSPDIRFLIDDTFDRMDETNRLFATEAVRRDLDAVQDDDASED